MLPFLIEVARNTWFMIAEMAPYLLFGFAVAGLLHILIRPERIRRMLGHRGLGTVVKACFVGVPMPLCSCSVIPVAASFRKSGASRGATASFLSSTPQTGVDSILATYALMGGVFTAVRVIVAFVTGIVTGFLVDLFAGKEDNVRSDALAETGENSAGDDCCPGAPSAQKNHESRLGSTKEGLRYGFITLPADLATALLIGLLLAGLITTLMPENFLSGIFASGPLSFLLATAISLPLYVCATASIPMAYALIVAGLSPGAALVFLIAGPATNTATVVTVWKMLGRKATAIYLATLLVISWTAGWLFNTTIDTNLARDGASQNHSVLQPELWQHLTGILLLAVLFLSIRLTRPTRPLNEPTETPASTCCQG